MPVVLSLGADSTMYLLRMTRGIFITIFVLDVFLFTETAFLSYFFHISFPASLSIVEFLELLMVVGGLEGQLGQLSLSQAAFISGHILILSLILVVSALFLRK